MPRTRCAAVDGARCYAFTRSASAARCLSPCGMPRRTPASGERRSLRFDVVDAHLCRHVCRALFSRCRWLHACFTLLRHFVDATSFCYHVAAAVFLPVPRLLSIVAAPRLCADMMLDACVLPLRFVDAAMPLRRKRCAYASMRMPMMPLYAPRAQALLRYT